MQDYRLIEKAEQN